MLLISLGASALLSLAYFAAGSLQALVLVQGLHGLAFGLGSTAVTTGALALIPPARRGEGAGYYGISTTLGSALGPLTAVLVVGRFGDAALFWATMCCGLAGFLVALAIRLPEREPSDDERRSLWSLHPSTLIDRSSLPISSIMLVAGLSFSGVLTFLNPYADAEGLDPAAGLYFLVYATTVLLSRLVVGRLQDAWGDNAIVYPLLMSLTAGMALLVIAPSGWSLILSAVLVGLGFGAIMPTVQTIAVNVSQPNRVGLVISTFFLMTDIGVGAGPIVDGGLVTLIGYRGMFAVLAALPLLAVVLYYLVHGRRPRSVLRTSHPA